MKNKIGVLKNLAKELEYLIEPALKFGIYQFDDDRAEFLERATAEERDILSNVAERYRQSEHHELVAAFLDDWPPDKHPESAKLFWLFAVMSDAGLKIDSPKEETVETHIQALEKFGSVRLASARAFAAEFLADFGAAAKPAIPALKRAQNDEDLRVQIWAHYALAIIEGDRGDHEKAIRRILALHGKKNPNGLLDEITVTAEAALEKLAELKQ